MSWTLPYSRQIAPTTDEGAVVITAPSSDSRSKIHVAGKMVMEEWKNTMLTYVNLIMLIITIVGLYFIYKKRMENEKYFIGKIIFYFCLGNSYIGFGKFRFPVWALLMLLFMSEKLNLKSKRLAILLGLFSFFITYYLFLRGYKTIFSVS